MIDRLYLYVSDSFDPYLNIATEKYLTLNVRPGECVMFLWQNENTVVVGRNQNCWSECRVTSLEADGGHLARRLSGGGAVFHDVENLNFTFSVRQEDYNVPRQLSVIAAAVKKYGIEAEVSGRNDILAGGCKFSGNAFWCFGESYYHHGTILIKTDKEKMARYLSVPEDKLRAKGVASVRSRVVNLGEMNPEITVDGIKTKLIEAFGEVYGLPVEKYIFPAGAAGAIAEYREEFDSPDWKYGRTPEFTHKFTRRFDWGGVTFCLDVRAGKIFDCAVYSDSLNPDLILSIPDLIRGRNYSADDLVSALADRGRETADIAELFRVEI